MRRRRADHFPCSWGIGVVGHPDHYGKGRDNAGVDPENEKSLRALAKAPGVPRVAKELYELTADALR